MKNKKPVSERLEINHGIRMMTKGEVEMIMINVRQAKCKNAKLGVYCELEVWKIQNEGCDMPRGNGTAYCGFNCKFK